jgi:hypothetical protein
MLDREKTPLKNWMERVVPTNLKGSPVRSIFFERAASSLMKFGFRNLHRRLTIQDACHSVSAYTERPWIYFQLVTIQCFRKQSRKRW